MRLALQDQCAGGKWLVRLESGEIIRRSARRRMGENGVKNPPEKTGLLGIARNPGKWWVTSKVILALIFVFFYTLTDARVKY